MRGVLLLLVLSRNHVMFKLWKLYCKNVKLQNTVTGVIHSFMRLQYMQELLHQGVYNIVKIIIFVLKEGYFHKRIYFSINATSIS